jgi:hypothetical protein
MPISQAYLLQLANQRGYNRVRDMNPTELCSPSDAMAAGKSGSVQMGNATSFQAVSSILSSLNSQAIKYRLTQELHDIKPTCDATIANWAGGGGNGTGKCYDPRQAGIVIIEVVTITQGPIGSSPQAMFWAIFYGDCGLNSDATTTISHYLSDPTIISGYAPVPPGSDVRWLIFWYQFEIPKVTAVGTRGA